MQLVEAHHVLKLAHDGYLGFLGHNPNIKLVGLEDADYIFYCSMGDGKAVWRDLRRLGDLTRKVGKPMITVTMGDDYTPCIHRPNIIRHFSSATKNWERRIPCCYFHQHRMPYNSERPLLAAFRGSYSTYPRRRIMETLRAKDVVVECVEWWQPGEHFKKQNIIRHQHLLWTSKFTLCPRGHGPSSMRLYEAMLFHSIPIMIDDESRPFNQRLTFAVQTSFSHLARTMQTVVRAMTPEEYAKRLGAMEKFVDDYLMVDEKAGCSGTIGFTEYVRKTVDGIREP